MRIPTAIEIRNTQRRTRISPRRIRSILRAALLLSLPKARKRGFAPDEPAGLEVSVLLVGDGRMRKLNREYRGKDKTTDVLSFPQGGPCGAALCSLGDIVISVPQTIRQAGEYGATFYEELARLLIHGLLHLLGYDHEGNAYQARIMRKLETEILEAICANGLRARTTR